VAAHAAQRLPEFLLVIAGDGPALGELRQRARALGLEQHVRFIGYLDRHAELADCYAAADVFAFASKTETQGLVLLEAMAAGLPVYALAELGTRDILAPRRGAVVAPDQPAAFAAGLVDLLVDATRRQALAAAARAWADAWSAPERARQLAGLYQTLATTHTRPARHATATCQSSLRHEGNATSGP
jgi:glycosyltransferase involved in cell wall biosynthesis